MNLTLIAAISENNVIGKEGHIPWNYPEDIKRFKESTLGHSVIMGRKTYESIPVKFRPLPERTNIVVTNNKTYANNGIIIVHSIQDAIAKASAVDSSPYVIGGQRIYEQTIDLASRLEITRVHKIIKNGNAFFPKIDHSKWKITEKKDREEYSFVTYLRR